MLGEGKRNRSSKILGYMIHVKKKKKKPKTKQKKKEMNNYSQEAGACVPAHLIGQGRLLCSLLSSSSVSPGDITPLLLVKHSDIPGALSQFTSAPQTPSAFHLNPNSAGSP